MRERVEVSSGLVLRRWAPRDAAAVTTAFADPLMREQTGLPIGSPEDALRWIAERADEWEVGSAFSFSVVDGADTVLGQVSVGAVNRRHSVGWVSYWTTAAARGGAWPRTPAGLSRAGRSTRPNCSGWSWGTG